MGDAIEIMAASDVLKALEEGCVPYVKVDTGTGSLLNYEYFQISTSQLKQILRENNHSSLPAKIVLVGDGKKIIIGR